MPNSYSPTQTPPAPYFPALTGLRAVAALLVFLYHVHFVLPASGTFFSAVRRGLILLSEQGRIGVSIFFVLSGFLIASRYADSVQLTGPWLRRYFQNRFARIYPLYFLITVLTFGAFWLVPPAHPITLFMGWFGWPTGNRFHTLVKVFLNLTLTRAFFRDLQFAGVPTAWTLTVEESFYVSAPLLLLGLKRTTAWLGSYPLVLLLAGVALVSVCSHFTHGYHLLSDIPFMLQNTYFGLSFEFVAGAGFARWLRQRPAGSRNPAHLTLLGALGVLACMAGLSAIERSPALRPEAKQYLDLFITIILLTAPILLVLWGLAVEQTRFQSLLKSAAFDLLGRSSYAFYLIHVGIIDTFFSFFLSENWLIRLPVYTLLSIALYKWVEHPLHERLRATPRQQPLQPALASQ